MSKLEKWILFVIGVNALCFLLIELPLNFPPLFLGAIDWVDYICICIFIGELVFNVRSKGFANYWKSNWNKFDFFIVISSLPVLLEPFFLSISGVSWLLLLRMGRFFRLARLIRLSRIIKYVSVFRKLSTLQLPVFALILTILLEYVIIIFDIDSTASKFYLKYYASLMIAFVGWIIYILYGFFHDSIYIPFTRKEGVGVNESSAAITSFLLKLTIVVGALYTSLNSAGYDPSGLLAGLGIGGIAIAIAIKDMLANVLNGIFVYSGKQFDIGDVITIGDVKGKVKEFGIRSVKVKDPLGNIVNVPNTRLLSENVINLTNARFDESIVNLYLDTANCSDKLEKAVAEITSIAEQSDFVADEFTVQIIGMKYHSHNLQIAYFVDIKKLLSVRTNLPRKLAVSNFQGEMYLMALKILEQNDVSLSNLRLDTI